MTYLGLYLTGVAVLLTGSGLYITLGYLVYLHKAKQAAKDIDRLLGKLQTMKDDIFSREEDEEESQLH